MKDIKKLLESLSIKYKDLSLYTRALTHPSYENETKCKTGNYQRLEFFGDAILEFIVSRVIFFNYPSMDEGNMTLLRSALVKMEPLFDMSKYINLGEYILLGQGEYQSKGYERPALVSDVFEAFIAAIYLDLGLDEATNFVTKFVNRYIEEKGIANILASLKDPKTRLQELMQADNKRTVDYKVVKEVGASNNKTYFVDVYMDDVTLGKGQGRSKQEAEQNAARDALNKMAK